MYYYSSVLGAHTITGLLAGFTVLLLRLWSLDFFRARVGNLFLFDDFLFDYFIFNDLFFIGRGMDLGLVF